MRRVVIVGGGIAGLTAAYRLRHHASVTLLEAQDRLGGVIRTERHGGFLIEGGPDSFLMTKPWAADLCAELGLADQLIAPSARTVCVLSGKRLLPLPEGLFLTVPTRIWPFLKSPLISWPGKFRMALDLVMPRGPDVADESIGSFVRRRLGREAMEVLAEPIMAGIYMGAADRISLRATFPRFAEIERNHRSLIRGLRRTPVTGNLSPFKSLRNGIGSLVDALVRAMPGVTLRTKAPVTALEPGLRVRTAEGVIEANDVIVAVPPPAAAALLRAPWPDLAALVSAIPTVGSTTVSLAYSGVALPEGTGFVIPRRENRRIVACSWSSQKYEGRSPSGRALVRCFLQGLRSDAAVVAREELHELFGIGQEPELVKTYGWPDANPLYETGHQERVRRIEERTPPGLHLIGAGFRGVGIPDNVRDATETAERIRLRPV